jgi:hypothetical protein
MVKVLGGNLGEQHQLRPTVTDITVRVLIAEQWYHLEDLLFDTFNTKNTKMQ